MVAFNNCGDRGMNLCRDCKHANYYVVYWWYPWLDPKCEISKVSVKPEDSCKFFEQIGRCSR